MYIKVPLKYPLKVHIKICKKSTMGTTMKVSDEIVAYRQSLKEEIQRINALD